MNIYLSHITDNSVAVVTLYLACMNMSMMMYYIHMHVPKTHGNEGEE